MSRKDLFLGIIIILYVIVSFNTFMADVNNNWLRFLEFIIFVVCILPAILFITIIWVFHWLAKRKMLDWFVKTAIIAYSIIVIIISLNLFGVNKYWESYPYILYYALSFFLPILPLTIHAHINKRNIEKYFHLLYMVFAPILLLFLYSIYDTGTKDIDSIVFLTMIIFIFFIPPLFVLKNCYLWYRR